MAVLQPGTRVGKFPVTRLLSAGGMGMLYEAIHPVLGSRVVVKTIRSEIATDPNVVERFRREAMSAARVRDERLPRIFDHDVLPDGTPYMVMELLEGEDLAARLNQGPLRPGIAARIMLEVLEVLAKVHRLGIVHRDIKPENIFMAHSDLFGELPKLLDFGVAHFSDDSATRPDEVLGTPLYMALEQADPDRPVGPWTDVFAAGVVLFECIAGAGARPWPARRPLAYLTAMRRGEPPRDLADLAPHAPPALCQVIAKALSVDAEGRYPDAEAFARALEPFAVPRSAMLAPDVSVTPLPAAPAADSVGHLPTAGTRLATAMSLAQPAAEGGRTRSRTDGDAILNLIRARLGVDRAPDLDSGRLVTGSHQHVTVLAVDYGVEDSGLGLDEATVAAIAELIETQLRQALTDEQCVVEDGGPGALLVLFGLDHTGEDDAERALQAAYALRAARTAVDEALSAVGCVSRLRLALHTGLVTRDTLGKVNLREGVPAVARRAAEAAPLNGLVASRTARDAVQTPLSWRAAGVVARTMATPETELFEVLGQGEALADTSAASRPFIGRADALAALHAALLGAAPSAAAGQRPPIVAVVGAAGVGKSRLLDAFVLKAGHSVEVLRARVEAGRGGSLVSHLLASALFGTEEPAPALVRHLERELRVLAHCLPEAEYTALMSQAGLLRELFGVYASGKRLPAPDISRERVFDLTALVLRAAAARARQRGDVPLVVCIDEAHRAEGEALALLQTLPQLTAGVGARLLVVARALEPLELAADLPVQTVPLGRMSAEEVATLVQALAGRAHVSTAVLDLIHERAGGSPLFVEELFARLADKKLLSALPAALADLRLPDSLYGLLLARVARLHPRLREVVRHLSVMGSRFEAALWAEISEELSDADHQTRVGHGSTPRDELVALVAARVLRREDSPNGEVFSFRQVLLRDAIYTTVLAPNRRLLHQLVARALERRHGDDPRFHPALLFHYSRAEAVAATVRYGRLVGRRGAMLGAYSDAVLALRKAAELQDRLPDETPLVRASTLVDLAWVCLSTGDLGEALEHGADAIALIDLDESAAAVALRARAHTGAGQAAYLRHDWERAQTELEMAEHLFERLGRVQAAAYARSMLGFVLRSMGRPEEGLPLAEGAWAIIEPTGGAGLLRVAHDLGNILRSLGRLGDALRVFDRAVEVANGAVEGGVVELGPTDAWLRVAIRSARAIVHADLGRLDQAIADQAWCVERAERVGRRMALLLTGLHLADHLVQRGTGDDLTRARALALRLMDLAVELRIFARAIVARRLLAKIATRTSRPAEAREHLEAAEFLGRSKPGCEAQWLAAAQALAQRYDADGRSPEADGLIALGRRIAAERFDDDLGQAVEAWAKARAAQPTTP